MGCCSSGVAPAGYEPQQARPSRVAPPQLAEEVVAGGFTKIGHQQRAGDPVRPKPKNFLPFVRLDVAKVPPEIHGGDHIYLAFTYSDSKIQGNEDQTVTAASEDLTDSCVFRCWRKDGTNQVILDGDTVSFEHVGTQLYLCAENDTKPLCLAEKDTGSAAQQFCFFKQGRPLSLKHRDTVFIESWLHLFVQEGYFDDQDLYAKKWERRQPMMMTVLKKKVLDTSTTELARKFQFQAFDLDGNGSISKAELDQMICMVRGTEVPPEEIDAIMAQADPSGSGQIPFEGFAAWADGGGLEEEQLQHVEVLGNIAQRCNDCLHDNTALIEVMATTDTFSVQAMRDKFANKLQAGDLAETIVTKAGKESDGWLYSGNWKNAMKALLEPEVDLWVRCLDDAMRGWGTDENSLTTLVCTMPERLRVQIFQKYKEKTGKSLLDTIKSETSSNYQKVLIWQAMAPEDCRASILNRAMVGLGTSEDQLIRVICQLNFQERKEVKEAYQRMYGRDLIEHIMSETSGNFQKCLKLMLEASEGEYDIDADCEAMKAAMDGWGTDEDTLIKLICSKTSKQMEDINAKFNELFGQDLLTRVKSETSGYFKDTLTGCIRHPMVQLAHSVRDCVKGWGTDDTGLITCLVHLEEFKKVSLIKQYQKEFGRDILKDIKNDTSGDYQKALCALIKPAPQVWAEALKGAMKGLGTADELLINFMVLSKDEMMQVRQAFSFINKGQLLEDWIEGDCSGDYRDTLLMLAGRNSEDIIDIMPLYWAQRCKDALKNVETLVEVLVSMPAVAIKRHTQLYNQVYGQSLRDAIAKRCAEMCSFFSFSDWFKTAMLALLDMPVERICRGLWDAMNGWGTDEYTLTAIVCTLPENLYGDVHTMYEQRHGKSLLKHIKSETSFNYKKVLEYQAMPWAESRALGLNRAMKGLGTSEDQLIRIIACSTFQQRRVIRETYKQVYKKDLIEHIKSETSGSFKHILVAVLQCINPRAAVDYDADCDLLKEAMEGGSMNEERVIKVIAGKTPMQIEELKKKYEEKFEVDLMERLSDETWSWGTAIFGSSNFRICILSLLREPVERLAYAVRDCIVGFGTDDTGLITLLVHLTERQRRDLVSKYQDIPKGGDLFAHIKGDTSGDYQRALLALVKPVPMVWAEALRTSMKGLGTSDNLLINWMCMSKDRMDEVREAFAQLNDGQSLAQWIAGDCSGDYKDLLVRLANRRCPRFSGQEVGLTMEQPATKEDAVLRFTKTFNKLCKQRKVAQTSKKMFEQTVTPDEADQQEMGCAFLYYGSMSSCAPNLDIPGLWDLTNAVGFPPADDGPDLVTTFHEWDYSGSGEITWNDFVREMKTRINDPGHFEAPPLPETIDKLGALDWAPARAVEVYGDGDDWQSECSDDPGEGSEGGLSEKVVDVNFGQAFKDGTWKDLLKDIEPQADGDGVLTGPWGDVLFAAVEVEHTVENYQERYGDGPAGNVLDFMSECGYESYTDAADKREQMAHSKFDLH